MNITPDRNIVEDIFSTARATSSVAQVAAEQVDGDNQRRWAVIVPVDKEGYYRHPETFQKVVLEKAGQALGRGLDELLPEGANPEEVRYQFGPELTVMITEEGCVVDGVARRGQDTGEVLIRVESSAGIYV